MIILDTNVISELMSSSPAENVERWVSLRPPTSLYTTCITMAEILFGVRLLAKGKRRDRVEVAATALPESENFMSSLRQKTPAEFDPDLLLS